HDDAIKDQLIKFLDGQFYVFFEKLSNQVKSEIEKYNIPINKEIDISQRKLSPSDVGFHNILKDRSGKLYFLDFEYFGWDDPAKMVSDFLQQPDVPVPHEYKEFFFESISQELIADKEFKTRFKIIYQLIGLKWCLIILNDFLPGSLEKRLFVNPELDKTKHQIVNEQKSFLT
ncbi:MAG: hypothetical protein QME68_07630, partial [Elusimicrobiota bacterium]|nr:hypothetical protein [Elusimicrobiota bacterium]